MDIFSRMIQVEFLKPLSELLFCLNSCTIKVSKYFFPSCLMFGVRPKINERERYSSYRKCVARVSWGHVLSVGIQHTASIGLAVNIYFYFLHFMYKLFHYFSRSFIDNICPNKDPFIKCKNTK